MIEMPVAENHSKFFDTRGLKRLPDERAIFFRDMRIINQRFIAIHNGITRDP